MALNAHLYITGQKQGKIDGSCQQKGREGSIEVIAVSHEIISPRDPASGAPTGKRMHKPYTCTSEVDIATPLLYNALCTNENITTWKLDFYRPNVQGIEEQYYTVELVNASIASISMKMANNRIPELMKLSPYHDTAFTYQKITWTIKKPTNKTASDDWETPLA